MKQTVNKLCPNSKLRGQLESLIERNDQVRLRKFFKRHKNDFNLNEDESLSDIKSKIIEYASKIN